MALMGSGFTGSGLANRASAETVYTAASYPTDAGLKSVISVTAMGAKGDGMTDDTAAIQAAITAAHSQEVYFPAGTYLVTGLTLPGAETLRGENATLKAAPTSTVILRGADYRTHSGEGQIQDSRGTLIEGLTLDGSSVAGVVGLEIDDTARTVCRQVKATHCTRGFWLKGAQFCTFENCWASYNETGVHIVNVPLVNGDGGGGNMNLFTQLQVTNNTVGVLIDGAAFAFMGQNYFQNLVPLSNSVAFAAFNSGANFIVGAAPESNAQGDQTLIHTVQGRAIPACAIYVSASKLVIRDLVCNEYNTTHFIKAASGGEVDMTDVSGYGMIFGAFATADGASTIQMRGNCPIAASAGFLSHWPDGTQAAWSVLYGEPSGTPDATFGNAIQVSHPGDHGMYPSLWQHGAVSTSTRATDADLGQVASVHFASSPGSPDNNVCLYSNACGNQSTGTYDLGLSMVLRSNVDTTLNIGFYPNISNTDVPLKAGQLTRVYLCLAAQTGNNLNLQMHPTDSAGATVAITRMHTVSAVAGSADAKRKLSRLVTGTYNAN